MFTLSSVLPNDGQHCLISEIDFHESEPFYAVAYCKRDIIRVFNSHSHQLLRTYKNPDAQLDEPHGVVVTERHIIVSNRHDLRKPSQINVYRIGDASGSPTSTFQTPLGSLYQAHSLAFRNGVLIASYCDAPGKTGALVSYHFDDNSGTISGPIDHRESCFEGFGDPKGVCFSDDGSKVVVSFNSLEETPLLKQPMLYIRKALLVASRLGPGALLDRIWRKLVERKPLTKPSSYDKNGLFVFEIDTLGRFSPDPTGTTLRKEFSRLENVYCRDGRMVITDVINDSVYIHKPASDGTPGQLLQVINEGLHMPHGAKFSPDGKSLLVTNFGLEKIGNDIQWKLPKSPRMDQINIYHWLT